MRLIPLKECLLFPTECRETIYPLLKVMESPPAFRPSGINLGCCMVLATGFLCNPLLSCWFLHITAICTVCFFHFKRYDIEPRCIPPEWYFYGMKLRICIASTRRQNKGRWHVTGIAIGLRNCVEYVETGLVQSFAYPVRRMALRGPPQTTLQHCLAEEGLDGMSQKHSRNVW